MASDEDVRWEMAVNDITFTVVACSLGGATVPILVIWILFSTSRRRRQPVFWIQMAALIMALTSTALEVAACYIDIAYKQSRMDDYFKLNAAKELLKWLVPPLTDTALIFRLLAFYPSQLVTRRKRLLMVAFPLLIKIPRLIAITINLVYAFRIYLGPDGVGWPQGLKWQAVETTLQLADNTYVSTIILVRIYRKYHARSLFSHTRSPSKERSGRLLFEACTMSFAPAVLLQLALALSMLVPLGTGELEAYSNIQTHLFTTNMYVSLTFSMLATSWSAISNTTAAQRIMAMPHRKLRYDESRTATSLVQGRTDLDMEGSSAASTNNEKGFFASRGTTQATQGQSGVSTRKSRSHNSDSFGAEEGVRDAADTLSRRRALPGWITRRFASGDRSASANAWSENTEEGRTIFLLRHGIEPVHKGEKQTLLYKLVQDDELERHAAGFYCVDDEQSDVRASKRPSSMHSIAKQPTSRLASNPPVLTAPSMSPSVASGTTPLLPSQPPQPSPGTDFNGKPLMDLEEVLATASEHHVTTDKAANEESVKTGRL